MKLSLDLTCKSLYLGVKPLGKNDRSFLCPGWFSYEVLNAGKKPVTAKGGIMFREVKRNFRKLSLVLLIVAAAFLVWGCGGGGGTSYTDVTEQGITKTATPLIEATKLKEWMDAGVVNAGYSKDNVVILHVGEPGDGVIPGAYMWVRGDSDEVRTTRLEGLALAGSMVQKGAVIDAVLQRSGVNKLSTIVLTGDSIYDATVTYFTLRYWGFDKNQIKLLNGVNAAWDATASALSWGAEFDRSTDLPVDVQGNPYNFSVSNNGYLNDDRRYSIADVIQAVDANIMGDAAGNNDGVFDDGERTLNIIHNTTGTPTLTSAIGISEAAVREVSADGPTTGVNIFKTKEDIELLLEGTDFDFDLPSITHCGSGLTCTPIFFALDAILGLDIAVWDGSTGQWRVYGAAFAAEDIAPADWNVNTLVNGISRSTSPQTRRVDDTEIDDVLIQDYERLQDMNAPDFNQIEEEDMDYMENNSSEGQQGDGEEVIVLC